jgi:hypothetical protein
LGKNRDQKFTQTINSETKQTHFSWQCVFSGTKQTPHFRDERDIKKLGFSIRGGIVRRARTLIPKGLYRGLFQDVCHECYYYTREKFLWRLFKEPRLKRIFSTQVAGLPQSLCAPSEKMKKKLNSHLNVTAKHLEKILSLKWYIIRTRNRSKYLLERV